MTETASQAAPQRMQFFEAVRRAFTRYSDFEGVAGRTEFWWYAAFVGLALSACNVFVFVALAPGITLGTVLAALFAIATLLPSLAIGVRRLRDVGMGWRNIFWILLPVAGLVILIVYWARPTAAIDGPGSVAR